MANKFKLALVSTAIFATWIGSASAAVVGSNNTAQSILDNSSINSTINIGTHGSIGSLAVSVAVDHTWVGDLIYSLTHGSTTVILMDRPGSATTTQVGYGSNLSASAPLTFSGLGTVAAELVGAPCSAANGFVGVTTSCLNTFFLSDQTLSAFAGMDVFGDWVLNISDNEVQDTGRLATWSLTANMSNNVPEPGSMALLGLAMAGLAVSRRKQFASN